MHSFDGDIWNEFEWEAHINQMEKEQKKLRAFFDHSEGTDKPRWVQLMNEYGSKIEAINAFIEEELLIEESYFPDDEDLDDEDDDIEDPLFGMDLEDDFFEDEDDDGIFGEDPDDELDEWDEEGEEWKRLSDDFVMSDYGSIEQLPIYNEARTVSADLLKLSDSGTLSLDAQAVRDFITQNLQVASKIAAGYSLGFDKEVMGANIAYNKKALQAANLSLQYWRGIYEHKLVDRKLYLEVHARLFELRNDIGVYVQELREKFENHGF